MSLLYAVVFASRRRSSHHSLALDALRHLRSPDAESWRNLLLHYHADYLAGATAPDDVFKDYKNHVLHVRDGDWGGAIEACEEWYRRTVRALARKDWAQAAWSAGVLSHYYVDPIQPFHTHQTEEEGVIHRALERSLSKSYRGFQRILERDLGGYPEPKASNADDWLKQMVRAGALASNPHYETIIEHYDFESALADPPAGLDQELNDIMAKLVGHAAAGFACILDRAFDEAAIKPPRVGGLLQAFFLAFEAPIQALLHGFDDARAQRQVQAQYEEFRRTGKVRTTLAEDDKVVRALYAAEVLQTPLSSLDAKWPREIGAKAGRGAPARGVKAKRRTPKLAELPPGARPPRTDKTPMPRFTLDGTAPVLRAPSIGPKAARRLEALGVKTVADLLALSPDAGQTQSGASHISAKLIKDWQAQALLACTVPGLRTHEAQALVACGVRDAGDLMQFDAGELTEAVARWGLSDEGARAWGDAPAPSEDDVADWIERARRAGKGLRVVKKSAA